MVIPTIQKASLGFLFSKKFSKSPACICRLCVLPLILKAQPVAATVTGSRSLTVSP
uniref:Uncharacterized protein n=1 Tax=Anguilla anguilla TaxID=7936 RepID=A0A0E9Q081_ANGAN